MTYRVEVWARLPINGSIWRSIASGDARESIWRDSSVYHNPCESIAEIIETAKTIVDNGELVNGNRPYRIVDAVSNQVLTEYNHDNLWLLERLR